MAKGPNMTVIQVDPSQGCPTARAQSTPVLSFALWRLVGLQSLMNASHFMAMPLLAVYCSSVLGLSAAATGAVLAVYFLTSRLTPVFIAPLADRYGLWLAVIVGLALRGLGFLGLALAPAESGALVLSAALGLGTSIYEAGAYGVIGAQPLATRERLIVLNAQSLNLGCVLGPLAGAGLAAIDLTVPIVLSGVLLAGLASIALLERAPELRQHETQPVAASYAALLADKSFLILCAALVPWWALFAQLFAAFPLEASGRGGSAGWASSVLVVNGAIGFFVLFAVPALMRLTGMFALLFAALAAGGLAVAFVGGLQGLAVLLALVALFSCAEIVVLASTEMLVGRHADGKAVSTYFAAFNMSWGLGGALGSALGPLVVSAGVGNLGWLLLGGMSLISIAGLVLYRAMVPQRILAAGP